MFYYLPFHIDHIDLLDIFCDAEREMIAMFDFQNKEIHDKCQDCENEH